MTIHNNGNMVLYISAYHIEDIIGILIKSVNEKEDVQ